MRIQPRQRLLEVWRAASTASIEQGDSASRNWIWGGREKPNSISDAEQLLCIMLPATEVPQLRLDNPDRMHHEIRDALSSFGSAIDIPLLLVRVVTDYLRRYSSDDDTPIFSGGALFDTIEQDAEPTPEQNELGVVESYGASITLMLSALGFARVFKGVLTRDELRTEVEELERLANLRLSAAMVGMLRSFAVETYDIDSVEGRTLLRTVNQARRPKSEIVAELHDKLREVAAGLRDINLGRERVRDLFHPGRLFECGWTWGVAIGAPIIDFATAVGNQPEGYALDAPYLYFTVVALDGIADLFSDRTRLLGLLDDEQQRLANALRIRWDLTQQFWATLASFGAGRWPLEDIPWRTIDEKEDDFFSLLVTSIAARDLAERRDTDVDLSRLGAVLTELAARGRITRRPLHEDTALVLHDPGVEIVLEGSEKLGPTLLWRASDFAPLLLKRALRVAGLINDIELRGQVLQLVDDVWDHISDRRLTDTIYANLWDQPEEVFGNTVRHWDKPSWHHTLRAVESLIIAASLADTRPLRSEPLAALATDLLAEAEHLFDGELLAGTTEGGKAIRDKLDTVRRQIRRAGRIIDTRPGTAAGLLLTVLSELDTLEAAREDVWNVS